MTPSGQESICPAWPVVLRYELEVRKEAMRQLNMNGASLATAFAAGRKSDELCTRYLITPLALGGTPKGTQEPRSSVTQQPKNKTQPQPKHAGKRPPQQVVPNAKSTKRQKQTSTKHAGGSEANNRYARVKKNAPSQLHMRNNDKSICFAFQTPKGCRRGETCYHQHVCAHCFGPHSFEECPNFSESRAAYLKQRLGSIRLARVSRKSVVKFQNQVVPAIHPVDDVLPTVSSASALGSVVNPVSEKEGIVGIPTRPAVLSCVPPVSVSDPQKLQFSSSAKSHDSAAFSQVFARISSDSSPDELTVSELRTSGLTPQQKSTGFLARERAQVSAPSSYKNPSASPAWKNRSLKVLSVFYGHELAPRVQAPAQRPHRSKKWISQLGS